VDNKSLKFSKFENLKIFEKFLPVTFQTSKQSVKFSLLFFCSKRVMNPVFSFYWLSFFWKKLKPTCNCHMLFTTIHDENCQEWQQHTSKEDPLNFQTNSSVFFSGYHTNFHVGHVTVGAWHVWIRAALHGRGEA